VSLKEERGKRRDGKSEKGNKWGTAASKRKHQRHTQHRGMRKDEILERYARQRETSWGELSKTT